MEGPCKYQLDDLDLQILSILFNDSRTPFLEIARQCHVSGGTIHVRTKKMEEMGIIKGTKLLIDTSKLGYDICAFVGIKLVNCSSCEYVSEELKKINEIIEIHCITGDFSILFKIICKDISHLHELLTNKIQTIKGIQSTSIFISLDQIVDRNINI
ncbi:Lrp/AsnC family transcriptional regulator, regulator for asnA, asnC and gidA [Clostridium sp. USBA 49]|uniref:Lrp/AsnC ligand binding domain-containing protein n=1 Tax=Clostridium TaxID=1485 RepID=UPI000999D7A6|nr:MULTISPECIES: Lrp/AsnC ligand binding domain-containing protein [Clostridium]SKA83999.1 Lrp/AsnC family transcriptional regulator, regulator for asnA, asnC and gidA [Clostridium sp. USBA 49]